MLKSPLIQTLQLLTQEEFETLHLFVVSPLFNEVNRYHDTVALFEYLKPHYPAFEHPDLYKDAAGSRLFPERKNPRNELEKAMSHLMRVLRQFITFQQFVIKSGKNTRPKGKEEIGQDPVSLLNFARQQLALMRFYSERLHQKPATTGLQSEKPESEHYFINLYDKLKKELYSQRDFSYFEEYEFSDLYYFRFLLEQEKALFDSLQEKRSGDRNLLAAMEALDQFYLITKLDMLCRLMHQIRMAMPFPKDSDEFKWLNANQVSTLGLVQSLAEQEYQQTPGVMLYSTLLECLSHPDPTKADNAAAYFSKLLDSKGHSFPSTRLHDFKVILRSYWTRKYRQTRDLRYLERVFDLQTEQLDELSPNEMIQASHLHNILITAFKLGKQKEAEHLIRDLGNRIAGTSNPDILRDIWWTMLRFEQKRFPEAEQCLPHYYAYGQMEDIAYYSWAAILDVKIRFELNTLDDDQHTNMLRATSARIERDKTFAPEARRERERFFPLALRLYKLKQKIRLKKGNHAKDLDSICADIEAMPVVHKEWLLEKCTEIGQLLKTENK